MPPPPKVRRYIPADRDAALVVRLEVSRIGHGFLGEAELQKQKALVRDHYLGASETWLVLDGDTPSGFIGLLDAFIGGPFVAPTAHGRGTGRQLAEHAAILKGVLEVEVYVANRRALGFCARCSSVRSGRCPCDDEGRALEIVQLCREHQSPLRRTPGETSLKCLKKRAKQAGLLKPRRSAISFAAVAV